MEIDKLEDIRRLSAPESNFRKILKSHLARLLEYILEEKVHYQMDKIW
jgi:hypothetical protein